MASIPTYGYASASIPIVKTKIISVTPTAKRLLRKLTFINNSGGPLTVDLWVDQTGITEVQFLNTKTIANLQTWSSIDIEGHVLEPNGVVWVAASGHNMAMMISTIYVT